MHKVPDASPYSVNWQSPVNENAGLNAGLRLWYLAAPIFAWSGTGSDGVLNNLLRSYQATAETGMQIIANGGAGASFLPRPGGWGCFKFAAAADQQITIPGNLFASLTAGTLAFWVMWDDAVQDTFVGSRYGLCLGRVDGGASYNNLIVGLTTSSAATAKIYYSPYAYNVHACETTTTPGNFVWNHACVTTKSGAHALYINGVLESTGSTAGSFSSDTSSLRLGGRGASTPSYMSGAMDDFRFYDRILSDTEVSQLYRESKSYYPNLLRRWRRTIELPSASTFKPAWAARCNKYMSAGMM